MIILAFAFFQIKHLVVDFFLQPAFEYKNKGTFLHWGGIRHALKHGLSTAAIIFLLTFSIGHPTQPGHIFAGMGWTIVFALFCGLIDFVIHYGVDYWKTNYNLKKGWGPTTHEEFWWLLGIDQFLHQMTYIAIIFLALA